MWDSIQAVLVRAAVLEDADAIARVRAAAMAASSDYEETDEEATFARLRGSVAGYLARTYSPRHCLAERVVFVAEEDSQVIGLMAGHRSDRMGCDGELQWAFVLPGFQRRGIGRLFFQPMRQWFIDRGCLSVVVDVPASRPAREFYRVLGAESLDEHWLFWQDISRLA